MLCDDLAVADAQFNTNRNIAFGLLAEDELLFIAQLRFFKNPFLPF